MTILYRTLAGRPYRWTEGGGWEELTDDQAPPDDYEHLMRGRTGPEAQSGRRALQKRASRRRQQSPPVIRPVPTSGHLAGSRPRPTEKVITILGGVTNT